MRIFIRRWRVRHGSSSKGWQGWQNWSSPVRGLVYEFDAPDVGQVRGRSFTPVRGMSLVAGSPCKVEFDRADPTINRVLGTFCVYNDPTLTTIVTILLIPAVLCLHLWLRAVLRLRIALREGRLTTAQIIESVPTRLINPAQVVVRYRFDDQDGGEHLASHRVRASSRLGHRLREEQPREHSVIHDERDPAVNRLVTADDFLAGSTEGTGTDAAPNKDAEDRA